MKQTAVLINIARGGLVDEKALKMMLMKILLASAAFDVFTIESPRGHRGSCLVKLSLLYSILALVWKR